MARPLSVTASVTSVEFADGRLRDVTHGILRDLLRVARAVAIGSTDSATTVERARRVVRDVEARRLARHLQHQQAMRARRATS